MNYFFYYKKLTFKVCNKFKTPKYFKITLYLLQIKIHQFCKILPEIELIKCLFFLSVKIHVFRVKSLEMLKNQILRKQTKNTKIWCVKIKNYKKHFNITKIKD